MRRTLFHWLFCAAIAGAATYVTRELWLPADPSCRAPSEAARG